MIYEVELSNLSYPDAPKKKTEVPGPNCGEPHKTGEN
jgi:hypothetical protein